MASGEKYIGYQCLSCGMMFSSVSGLISHLSAWRRVPRCPKRIISLSVQDVVVAGGAVDGSSACHTVASAAPPALYYPLSKKVARGGRR